MKPQDESKLSPDTLVIYRSGFFRHEVVVTTLKNEKKMLRRYFKDRFNRRRSDYNRTVIGPGQDNAVFIQSQPCVLVWDKK